MIFTEESPQAVARKLVPSRNVIKSTYFFKIVIHICKLSKKEDKPSKKQSSLRITCTM